MAQGSAAMGDPPNRALVFRVGQLGDVVMSLPAIWAVRRHWPNARLTLLCDAHPGRGRVLGSDILGSAGLFDSIEHYDAPPAEWSLARRLSARLRLMWRLRRGRYDALVYLAPSIRRPDQVRRDLRFFTLAGCGRVYGASYFPPAPVKRPGAPFATGDSEADLLLARLAADGIPVPGKGQGSLDMRLGQTEAAEVALWRSAVGPDGGRTWIGVGPGSKMPAKRWPLDRFGEAVARLISRHDVWPVVFGGPEDRGDGATLIARWRRGFNAAGELSVRGSAAALRRCALYLGNDTGTMHLAASAGAPCAAVFSARDWPGAWYPYGVARRVFRAALACEGCYLETCAERANACLTAISVDEVVAGCEELLALLELESAASVADASLRV
jgi:ADP-heptose:LPS heptosyltransferase